MSNSISTSAHSSLPSGAKQVIPEFNPASDTWPMWLQRFERACRDVQIQDDKTKLTYLLKYIGETNFSILQYCMNRPPQSFTYREVCTKLKAIFDPVALSYNQNIREVLLETPIPRDVRCYYCGENHYAPDCTVDPETLWCTGCNREGHIEEVCFSS